jgi:hypothetical protein
LKENRDLEKILIKEEQENKLWLIPMIIILMLLM